MPLGVNSIILLSKKAIYDCMKKGRKPHIASVKTEMKHLYFQEKYRFCMKRRKKQFENIYFFLKDLTTHPLCKRKLFFHNPLYLYLLT